MECLSPQAIKMDVNDVHENPCESTVPSDMDIDIEDPISRHPKEVETICEEVPMVVAEFPGANVDTSSEQDCKEREYLNSTDTSTQLNTGLLVTKNEIQLAYLPPKNSLGIVQNKDSQSEASEGVDTNSEINEPGIEVSTTPDLCDAGAGVVSESSYLMRNMTGVQNNACPDDSVADQRIFQSSDNPPECGVALETSRSNQGKTFFSPAVKRDPSNAAWNDGNNSTVGINLCDDASDTPNNSEDDDDKSCNDTGAVAETCVQSDGMPSLSSVFENTSLLISLNSQTIDVETVKSIILRLKKGRVSVLDDAAAYVASDITYKVKLVLQEATKFMQMGKRRRLRHADIDHAVRLVNSELPLFGIGAPPSLSKCKTSGTGEKSGVLVDKRQVISYADAAAEMQAAQVPRETVIHEHWLHLTEEEDAVHIPWVNTNLNPQNSHEGKEGESPNDIFTAASNSEDATEAIQVDPFFSDDDCKNLSLSSLALRCHLQKPKTFVYNELIHLRGQSYGLLTKELEIYFREIKNACFGACEDSRALAFQSLQHDPNITKMVSHLCSFISRRTVKYVANPNLKNLSTVMRMLHQILLNKYILNMKLFLHEVLPAIVTCIVCSTISQSSEYEDHWKLRNYGAELLKFVCDKYSSPINNIQGRAVAVFQKALHNKELDFAAVYGSLRALKVLGVAAVGTDMVQTEATIKQRVDEFLSRSGASTDKQRRNAIRIQDHFKAQQKQLASTAVVVKNTPKVKPKAIPNDQGPKQEPPKIIEECKRPQPQLSPWRMAVPRKSPHAAPLSKLPVIGTTIDGVPFKPMPIPRFPQPSTANIPTQTTVVHNQSQQLNLTQGMHFNSENTSPFDNKIQQHGHSTKTDVDHTHAPIEDTSGGSSSGIYLQTSSSSMQAFSAPNFHDYSLKQYRVVRPPGSGDVSRVQGAGNSNRKSQSCVRNPGAEALRSPSEISGDGRCEALSMMNSRLPAPRFKTLAAPRLLPPRRGTVPLSGAASIIAAGTHAYTEEDLANFSSTESATTPAPATHYTLQQVNGEFYLQPVYVSGAVRPRLLSSPRGNADTGVIAVRQQHQASPDLALGSNCTVSSNIVDTSVANQASSPSASSQATSCIAVPTEQTSLVANQSAQNLLAGAGTDTGSKVVLDKLVSRENQEGQ